MTKQAAADFNAGNMAAACADSKAALAQNPNDRQAYGIFQLTCDKDRLPTAPPPKPEPPKTPPPADGPGGVDLSRSKGAIVAMGSGIKPAALPAKGPGSLNDQLLRVAAAKADGNYDLVISQADEALRFAPLNADLLDAKAFAQNRTKDYKGALATADKAIAADPKNAAAHANKAFALGALGDRAGMIAELRKAALLDPRFEEALQKALNSAGDAASLFDFPGEVRESKLQGSKAAEGGGLNPEMLKWIVISAIGLPLMGLFIFFALRNTVLKTPRPMPGTPWPQAATPPQRNSGRLDGKYEVGARIGMGGMGEVFEGKDVTLDRKVAIKKMLPQLAAEPRERQRFVSEAKTVAALHHSNIVDIHAIVEEGQDAYLIFEYVAGKTLHDLISARGRLPFPEAAKIIRDVAAALDFAHSKDIVHRDLKPANVMINDQGVVKVMDFGLARAAQDALSKLALTNTIVGTPAYMVPEQESGVVCKQSDVYSLAICLYEMLSGRRPFDGAPGGMMVAKLSAAFEPIGHTVQGLPPGLDGFFARALAADPQKRIPTPREFVAALDAIAATPA